LPSGVRNTMQAISQNNALIHKQSETVQAIINRMSDAGELDISNTKELNSLIQYLSSSEGARLIGDESAVDTNINIRSNELVSGWRRSDLLRNIASSLTSSRSYKDIASTLFRNRNLSDSQRRRLAEEYVSSKYAGKTISDSKRKAEIQSVLNATNY